MKKSTFREGGFCASDTKSAGALRAPAPAAACRRPRLPLCTTGHRNPAGPTEPSAYWIVPRPRAPSHRIVDDRDPRSLGPIPDRKETAAEQRRSEGSEEIRADLVSCKPQALGNRSVVPFDSEDVFPGVISEQIVDDAGALHTRNRLNLFEHAVVQVGPLRGEAEGRRGGDLHHKDPLGPESRINVVRVLPASDEQTGADEQNDRKRKFSNPGAAASRQHMLKPQSAVRTAP